MTGGVVLLVSHPVARQIVIGYTESVEKTDNVLDSARQKCYIGMEPVGIGWYP